MAQGKGNRLSAEQRADMWRRWKAGESLHEIFREAARHGGRPLYRASEADSQA